MVKKKTIGFIVGAVGFVSAVVGLWPFIFPETPDNEVVLVDDKNSVLILNAESSQVSDDLISAGLIVIDGIDFKFPLGGLMVSNNLTMQNGGTISGESISILATNISGGSIVARNDSDLGGGKVVIASAQINGTTINADGRDGADGANGVSGQNGARGGNGRRGNCDGFGAYRGAAAGASGGNGTDGTSGADGQHGGHGGNISVFYSAALTNEPTAIPGNGGLGGVAGKGGLAGAGGSGGRGCTGIGGTQSNARNGAAGEQGKEGTNGRNGNNGNQGSVFLNRVDFKSVKKIVKSGTNPDAIWLKLKQIPLES